MRGWEDNDAIGVTVRTGVLNEFYFFARVTVMKSQGVGRETELPPKSSNNEALQHSQSTPLAEMFLVVLQGKR